MSEFTQDLFFIEISWNFAWLKLNKSHLYPIYIPFTSHFCHSFAAFPQFFSWRWSVFLRQAWQNVPGLCCARRRPGLKPYQLLDILLLLSMIITIMMTIGGIDGVLTIKHMIIIIYNNLLGGLTIKPLLEPPTSQ